MFSSYHYLMAGLVLVVIWLIHGMIAEYRLKCRIVQILSKATFCYDRERSGHADYIRITISHHGERTLRSAVPVGARIWWAATNQIIVKNAVVKTIPNLLQIQIMDEEPGPAVDLQLNNVIARAYWDREGGLVLCLPLIDHLSARQRETGVRNDLLFRTDEIVLIFGSTDVPLAVDTTKLDPMPFRFM